MKERIKNVTNETSEADLVKVVRSNPGMFSGQETLIPVHIFASSGILTIAPGDVIGDAQDVVMSYTRIGDRVTLTGSVVCTILDGNTSVYLTFDLSGTPIKPSPNFTRDSPVLGPVAPSFYSDGVNAVGVASVSPVSSSSKIAVGVDLSGSSASGDIEMTVGFSISYGINQQSE